MADIFHKYKLLSGFLRASGALLMMLTGVAGVAGESDPDTIQIHVHTPLEIIKVMARSSLVYEPRIIGEASSLPESTMVIEDSWLFSRSAPNWQLVMMEKPSDAELALMERMGEALEREDYFGAADLTQQAIRLSPGNSTYLSLLGNALYFTQQYDSAASCYRKAIESNFVDFNAHLFLASTYLALGEPDSALNQITVAHVLNRNHELARGLLLYLRIKTGRPFDDWHWCPEYSLDRIGDTVVVSSAADCVGYALVKALWKYEPGYADSVCPNCDLGERWNPFAEREAVTMAVAMHEELRSRIEPILDDGFITPFALYEVVGIRDPMVLMTIPKDYLDQVIEYVDRYH